MVMHVALLTALALAAPMGHGKHSGPRPTVETHPCTVSVTGAITATFKCTTSARFTSGGGLLLVFSPEKLPKKIGAFLAGPFEIKGPIEEKVPQGAASFKSGRIMVSGARHASYGAEVGKTPRGDLSVVFASVVTSAPEKQEGPVPGEARAATVADHAVSVTGTLGGRLVSRKGQPAVDVTISF